MAPARPVTDSLSPRRRCGQAGAAAGSGGGATGAQLLPCADQLRSGRVLAGAGGGASHGLQISFPAPHSSHRLCAAGVLGTPLLLRTEVDASTQAGLRIALLE